MRLENMAPAPQNAEVVAIFKGVRASSRRLRTLSAELRKLPDHKNRQGLGLRSKAGKLSVTWKELTRTRWTLLDIGPDATDAQITAAVGRALATADEKEKDKEVPIATGQLSRLRRLCLLELDRLELTDTVRRARGRHVDACIAWLEERSLAAVPSDLLAYIRSTERTSRRRRDAIATARLLLRIGSCTELAISPADNYIPPVKELVEADDPEQTLAALIRLWEADHESAWITSWVALTGCRGSMVLSSELMWKPTRIEIGAWIQCRDNKKGRNRNSRILPSWRKCLEVVGEERLADVPQVFLDVRLPYNSAPASDAHKAAELVMIRMTNRVGRKVPEPDRSVLGFRALRHQRVSALLDAGLEPLRVAEIASTGLQPLLKRYSDHHRFRAAEDVKRLL